MYPTPLLVLARRAELQFKGGEGLFGSPILAMALYPTAPTVIIFVDVGLAVLLVWSLLLLLLLLLHVHVAGLLQPTIVQRWMDAAVQVENVKYLYQRILSIFSLHKLFRIILPKYLFPPYR